MFGKKNSGAPKSKPKKSVKQGPKVNFFAAHTEKLVLAAVVGALAFLIFDGLGGKTYDKSKQPKQLEDQATQLISNIRSNDPWPEISKDRKIAHGYTPQSEAARVPTNPELYPARDWEPNKGSSNVNRQDPTLLPPIKLLGQSIIGLIAMEAEDNYVDPFEDFIDAPKLKGKGASQSGRNTRRQTDPYGGDAMGGMMGEGAGGMGMGMGGMGGTGTAKRLFPSKYNLGFSLFGSAGGMGMGMGGMGGYGGETGGGMMGDAMGGMGGMMGAGMGGQTGGGIGSSATATKQKKYKAQPTFFNAVTALVPHDDMLKDFTEKLRNSSSYNPMRDRPIYLNFEVQRAEVKSDNQPIAEGDWKKCTDGVDQLKLARQWAKASIPEVIDPGSYAQALTMPIPPLLMQDYRKFAKHPDIDWIWDAGLSQVQLQQQYLEQAKETAKQQSDALDNMLPGDRPSMGGGMMGGGMMGGGMGGYGGDAMGGMGGMMGDAMGGMGGMAGGYGGGDAMGGMGGGMMGGGMMGDAMGGMAGMAGMGGMGGYGGDAMGGMGGMGGMGASAIPVKYKMIRFYDKLAPADVSKTFKYRVRVMMEDPNYPKDGLPAPLMTEMETKVFERVSQLRAKEDPLADKVRQENAKRVPVRGVLPPPKIFNRTKLWTDWSQPSNGIYVRGTDDVFVHRMSKKSANPEVEAVMVRLDMRKGAYVPMYIFNEDKDELKKIEEERDIKLSTTGQANRIPLFKRGALLQLEKYTTHFAHPITNILKRYSGEEWSFMPYANGLTNVVVDIRGGDNLAGNNVKEDPLTDNVEMMMLMNDGRVEVTNEFDDAFNFRGFTLADEREAADKTGSAANTGYGAGGMMGPGS